MTWWQIAAYAKIGVPVRREAWATGRTLTYVAGLGTARAVAVIRASGVETVVTPDDFAAAEFLADDWELA